MSINVGNTAIREVYLGSAQISEVYVGSTKVYPDNVLRTFTITIVSNISNGHVDAPLTYSFSGIAGSTHSFANDCDPNSGYENLLLSSVSSSNSALIVNTSGDDILGTLTMPNNGGSAIVTVYGSASFIDTADHCSIGFWRNHGLPYNSGSPSYSTAYTAWSP